ENQRVPTHGGRTAEAGDRRGRCPRTRVRQRDPGWHRWNYPGRSVLEAKLIAGTDLRSDMKDFGPSCFHRASTGGSNANATPEGGAFAIGNAKEFGCGGRQPPLLTCIPMRSITCGLRVMRRTKRRTTDPLISTSYALTH